MEDKDSKRKEPTDEELIKQIREEFAKLKVKDFLSQTLITLSTLAYQKMGVPAANEPHKDLDQAKLAIDAYSSLLTTLEPQLESQEINAFKEVLSKLRIDFVSKNP